MNLTMTHALFLDLTRTDRLVGPTPLSFLVDKAYVVPHGLAEKHWNLGVAFFGDADQKKCREIQARGGQGLALLVFRVPGPNDTSMFWFQRFEVEERVSATREGMRLEEVFELVKKVANHDVPEEAVRRFLTADDLRNSMAEKPGSEIDVFEAPRLRPAEKSRHKRKQTGKQ